MMLQSVKDLEVDCRELDIKIKEEEQKVLQIAADRFSCRSELIDIIQIRIRCQDFVYWDSYPI